MMAHAGGN
jgi:hypothetical protein